MSNYTESELNHTINRAISLGNQNLADFARKKLAELKSSPAPKLPNMDAYLAKCVARCRPKEAK